VQRLGFAEQPFLVNLHQGQQFASLSVTQAARLLPLQQRAEPAILRWSQFQGG
jgi:hypothetical protein